MAFGIGGSKSQMREDVRRLGVVRYLIRMAVIVFVVTASACSLALLFIQFQKPPSWPEALEFIIALAIASAILVVPVAWFAIRDALRK